MENKVERMQNVAKGNDWQTQIVPEIPESGDVKEIVWKLYCVRDLETLRVVFIGKLFEEATYTYGEYKSTPARPGAVYDILEGVPNPNKLKVTITDDNIESHRNVPWDDDDDSPAFDVLLGVLDRTITWVRNIDNEQCTSYVDRSRNLGKSHFKLYKNEKTGLRYLEWVDLTGYHTVPINRIIHVE